MVEGPEGPGAQALAVRWATLIGHDAGGNQEIEKGIRKAWAHRSDWPARFREHVASLYLVDQDSFESVSRFLDEAISRSKKLQPGPH